MSGRQLLDLVAGPTRRALVGLRSREPQDEPFLRDLYASTREEELALVPWTLDQKRGFLAMQFEARERQYLADFPAAEDNIVTVGGQPAGRLEVNRDADQLLVVDIALAPVFRGQGIGTALVRSLLEESVRSGLPVRLHVDTASRARHLYERLGFRPVEESPLYLLMEWNPRLSRCPD